MAKKGGFKEAMTEPESPEAPEKGEAPQIEARENVGKFKKKIPKARNMKKGEKRVEYKASERKRA